MIYEIEYCKINNIYKLLDSMGYFKSDNYDIKFTFENTFKFGIKIKRPDYTHREMVVKYPSKNTNKEFYDMLYEYLKTEFEFDLVLYAFNNNIPVIGSYTLFSILHEFGHAIEYINRINNGGDYLDRQEMMELSKYWEVSKIEDKKERFYAYRKIDKEEIADKNAIMIMKKYNIKLQSV